MYGAIKNQQILQPIGMVFLNAFFAMLIQWCSTSCHGTQPKLARAT